MNIEKLQQLASETIRQLESKLSRRGWTTGFKKWELELLFFAYEGLEMPMANRKFGLDKIKDASEIERRMFGNNQN